MWGGVLFYNCIKILFEEISDWLALLKHFRCEEGCEISKIFRILGKASIYFN